MWQFEAFAGFEHKYNYSMVGHSGDTPCAPLVAYGSPPDNEKQRLQVVQRMAAHTQFCMSGDHTLEATRDAIAEAASHTDCDEVRGAACALCAVLQECSEPSRDVLCSRLSTPLTLADPFSRLLMRSSPPVARRSSSCCRTPTSSATASATSSSRAS